MVQGKWFAPGTDLSALLPVRSAVFGTEADSLDAACWNVLVYEDSVPAATGRIWWEDGAYWLGGIGVLEDRRRRKLGDLVLRLLLYKAQNHAAREVRLRCSRETAGFFSRLGLKTAPRPPAPTGNNPEYHHTFCTTCVSPLTAGGCGS